MTTTILLSGFLPPLLWLVVVRQLDRHDREPARALLGAFAIGAVPVIIVTLLVGSQLPVAGEFTRAVVVAPVLEEILKVLALVWFTRRRTAFDEPVDGIVYAASIGLGFAATENVLYFASASGSADLVVLIFLRSAGSAVLHLTATALAGEVWGREHFGFAPRGSTFVVGLPLAIAWHAVWNLLASAGLLGIGPAFILLIWIIRGPLRRRFRAALAVSPHRHGVAARLPWVDTIGLAPEPPDVETARDLGWPPPPPDPQDRR